MKLAFSVVILELLYISLCVEAYCTGGAVEAFPLLSAVPEMLENVAASTVLILGGAFFLGWAKIK